MKFPRFSRTIVCALALALVSATAFAAKPKQENEYPNATRKEPKTDISERDSKDLSKAADLAGDGKGDEARALIEKVLGNSRASGYAKAYAHQLLGRIYWDEDKEDQAIAELKTGIELDALPNASQFQTIYQVAQMQVQGEKYADALASLEQWEKLTGKTTPEELALKGNIYYRLEKFQEAVDAMKRAIATAEKPNDSWTQILMASYFELDQYGEAATIVEQQLAKDPSNIKLIKQLATIYIQADNYPKALDVLAKARAGGLITSGDDYMQLAKLYLNAEKPKDAIETLKEGLDKGIVQPSYEVYKLQGDLYAQADNDAAAIEAYTKASPLATDGNADYQLGYMLFYADRASEAKAALGRALSKGGLRQEGEAYLLRGDAENELGEAAAAMADWQKALAFPSAKPMAEQRIKAAKTGVKLKRNK